MKSVMQDRGDCKEKKTVHNLKGRCQSQNKKMNIKMSYENYCLKQE